MKRVGIVYLISESPEAKGVLDEATEKKRKTYCEIRSIGMSETYQARASGFAPSIKLFLPQDFEYKGETLCELKGVRYKIIRDYRDDRTGDGTELTRERVRGNAAEYVPAPAPDPEPEDPTDPEDPEEAEDGDE